MKKQKLFLFQIDALSYARFIQAFQDKLLPKTQKWLRKNNYQIKKYFTGLPASTFTFQARLFFGEKRNIPSYRWYDKKRKQPISASIGEQVTQIRQDFKLETRSIFSDLVVLESIFSLGDQAYSLASETFSEGFSIKSLKFKKPLKLLGLNLFFILECLTRMPVEALRCVFYWFSAKRNSRIPFHWYSFWGWYWLNLTLIFPYYWYYLSFLIKKRQGSVYYNFGGYDSFAHAFGNYAKPAQEIIKALDKQIIRVFKKAVKKGFLPILFSDHGMTPSAIFQKVSGKSLKEWFKDFVRDGVLVEEYPLTEMRGSSLDAFKSQADVFISSSGPISLIYFTKDSQRLTKEKIEKEHPKLIEKVKEINGIGLIGIKTEKGYWVGAKEGSVELGGDGLIIKQEGIDPLVKYSNLEKNTKAVFDWLSFENQGDLVLMGDYDGVKTVSFEEQVACHCGLGGEQTEAFYCCPKDFEENLKDLILP